MKLVVCQQKMSQKESCNVYTDNVTNFSIMANKTLWREFGGWIKSNRESKKLSQEGLGDLVQVDRQTVYRIEAGKSGTTRETVIKFAQALNLDEKEALSRAGFGTGQIYSENELLKSVRYELHGAENWSDDQKAEFLNVLKLTVAGIKAKQEEEKREKLKLKFENDSESNERKTLSQPYLKAEMRDNLRNDFGEPEEPENQYLRRKAG